MKIRDRLLGPEREGWHRGLLGAVLDKQGKHKEAEAQIRQALRLNEKALGVDPSTLDSRTTLARNLWYRKRNTEAETYTKS